MTTRSHKRPRDPARAADDPRTGEAAEPATYQGLLDEALCMTFPASDPIAVGVAMEVQRARPTGKDTHDWPLAAGGDPPVRLPPRRR